MINDLVLEKAKQIQLLILDVDGVLTDGKIWLLPDGDETKCFHIQDGLGITHIQKAGIQVAVISGRNSKIVQRRMHELNVAHVFQGVDDKLPVFQTLLKKLNITAKQAAYVGDDFPDIPILKKVGLSIAVNNAVNDVKHLCDWHTHKSGGEGAVREVCDLLLKVRQ